MTKYLKPNARCAECGKPLSPDKSSDINVCRSKRCIEIREKKNRGQKPLEADPSTHDGAFLFGLICAAGRKNGSGIEIETSRDGERLLRHIALSTGGMSENRRLRLEDREIVEKIISLGGNNFNEGSAGIFSKIPEDKRWSFICGWFEGTGWFEYNCTHPEIGVSGNWGMAERISAHWGVNRSGNVEIRASGYKALDICGRMYENVSFKTGKKYEYFMDILNWEPLPPGPWLEGLFFKCKKLDPRAVVPSKKRVTDSGYDIYAVELDYDPETNLYTADTRLSVEPIPGYYFDMLGRSSLPLSGFAFAGCVGVIDRSYVGSLKMRLLKINPKAVPPPLPFRCGQLIPRKIIHADFVETNELSESERGDGGFGSTGL